MEKLYGIFTINLIRYPSGVLNEIIDSKTGILIKPKLVHDTKLGIEANYFSQNCITCTMNAILKLDETEINNKSNNGVVVVEVVEKVAER